MQCTMSAQEWNSQSKQQNFDLEEDNITSSLLYWRSSDDISPGSRAIIAKVDIGPLVCVDNSTRFVVPRSGPLNHNRVDD